MKTILYVTRHAIDRPLERGQTDAARPLDPCGKRVAALLGKTIAAEDESPRKIYCAPEVRTLTTAGLIGAALKDEPLITDVHALREVQVEVADELAEGENDLEDFVEDICDEDSDDHHGPLTGDGDRHVMIVGHSGGLDHLLKHVLDDRRGDLEFAETRVFSVTDGKLEDAKPVGRYVAASAGTVSPRIVVTGRRK